MALSEGSKAPSGGAGKGEKHVIKPYDLRYAMAQSHDM